MPTNAQDSIARFAASAIEIRVELERLAQLSPDGMNGVEGTERVLKDHPDALASYAFEFPLRHDAQVLAFKQNTPVRHAAVSRQQSENGLTGDAFSAPAFTDDAQCLSTRDLETDIVDHFGKPGIGSKADAQAFNR